MKTNLIYLLSVVTALIFYSCDVNDGNHPNIPRSELQIHSVNLDGSNHKILSTGWDSKISVSKNLVFYKDGYSLKSMRYDGTELRTVLTDRANWDYNLSENGEKSIFTVVGKNSNDIHIMDLTASSLSKVFSADNIYQLAPDLSQDMSEIVFTTSWDLCKIDVTGNNFEILRKHPDSTIFRKPRYVLGKTKIVYFEDYARRSDTTFLRFHDVSANIDTILLTLKKHIFYFPNYDISPDGKILFLEGNERSTDSLKILDLVSGTIKGLDMAYSGSFSPDGKYIIYVNKNSIYIINSDGGDRKIVYTEKDSHYSIHRPVLSPDNKTVVYECTQSDYAPEYTY